MLRLGNSDSSRQRGFGESKFRLVQCVHSLRLSRVMADGEGGHTLALLRRANSEHTNTLTSHAIDVCVYTLVIIHLILKKEFCVCHCGAAVCVSVVTREPGNVAPRVAY